MGIIVSQVLKVRELNIMYATEDDHGVGEGFQSQRYLQTWFKNSKILGTLQYKSHQITSYLLTSNKIYDSYIMLTISVSYVLI